MCPGAAYLLSLVPAVLLRSLLAVVAKGNRVARRRSFGGGCGRRPFLFFRRLSLGFLGEEAAHGGLETTGQAGAGLWARRTQLMRPKLRLELFAWLGIFQLPVSRLRFATNRNPEGRCVTQSQTSAQ